MASSSGELVIKDFRTGIGPSPHLGFGDMRNLDISTIPGIARLNYASSNTSGTALSDYPIQIVRNPQAAASDLFALDASGALYISRDSGTTWSSLTGFGTASQALNIQVWENYLFLATTNKLHVCGPVSSATAWTNNWQTIDSDEEFHPMLWSVNDGNLYGGALNFVFSVSKASTTEDFWPTGGATSYTFTQRALDLPGGPSTTTYRVKCLEELGNNLMIGTDHIANSQDRSTMNDGAIFPWDRTSSSFGQPIVFNKNGVNQMKVINEVLYVNAGTDGKYYQLTGGRYSPVVNLPQTIVNLDAGRFLRNNPNAITQFQDKLLFGMSPGATATDIGGFGVWSLDVKTGVLNFEHSISTGNMGDTSAVRIGSILPLKDDRLLIGWKDGATAGIDVTGTGRYGSYRGYFDSPFYQVGTPLEKREFTQIEFQLVEPLATGQGVKLSYRTNLSASFTTIGTYDYATLGAVQSHNAVADIPACEFVQIRVALTCAGTNASPQLRTVTLR